MDVWICLAYRETGGGVYILVQITFAPNYSEYLLLAINITTITITMGIKSTYQELVHKQPPSFAKRGEYKIQKFKKPLGRGSTGKVVKAIWIDGGIKKEVALKYVSYSLLPLPPLTLPFSRTHLRMLVLTRRIVDKAIINDKPGMVAHEIGILKELNHENIVSFYDTFESKHKYVHFYQSD